MGLDMYLRKHTFISSYERADDIKKALKPVEKLGIDSKKITEIKEEAMYWRKANQIHKWFVEKVQNGTDNCEEYEVSTEQLQQLLADVNAVLKDKDKAESILPTQSGFFFGGTDIDKYYFDDLKRTKKELTAILKSQSKEKQKKGIYTWFTYRSSW